MELLQLWIRQNEINLFSTKLLESLPEPEFYVVYNGKEKLKETKSRFKLERFGIKVEVEVEILDIRLENLKDSRPQNALAGYSYLNKTFEENVQKGIERSKAFEAARQECMKRGYMAGFIEKEEHIMDYKENWLDYDFLLRAEGEAEGEARGIASGASRMLELLKSGLNPETALQQILNESGSVNAPAKSA
jgi:hypothetical protein